MSRIHLRFRDWVEKIEYVAWWLVRVIRGSSFPPKKFDPRASHELTRTKMHGHIRVLIKSLPQVVLILSKLDLDF